MKLYSVLIPTFWGPGMSKLVQQSGFEPMRNDSRREIGNERDKLSKPNPVSLSTTADRRKEPLRGSVNRNISIVPGHLQDSCRLKVPTNKSQPYMYPAKNLSSHVKRVISKVVGKDMRMQGTISGNLRDQPRDMLKILH